MRVAVREHDGDRAPSALHQGGQRDAGCHSALVPAFRLFGGEDGNGGHESSKLGAGSLVMRSGQAPSSQLFIALPYRPAETDFSIVDAQIEAAVGIGADPRLVSDRRALTAIV